MERSMYDFNDFEERNFAETNMIASKRGGGV